MREAVEATNIHHWVVTNLVSTRGKGVTVGGGGKVSDRAAFRVYIINDVVRIYLTSDFRAVNGKTKKKMCKTK